ncbi:Polyribonucleotide nucleotidyltransferase [Sporotomaculum syntrophicum]|uniref:Polyribonucleotide nucleotidyltransferase n=2 Tax=Sporotomaculum syntrophicum TaxID=182264 RepID=A0A9D2WQ63_9FIRM|nr:Polyribonucleotide nucleotidyltransferase [Sporotomaculum syntrophicum]
MTIETGRVAKQAGGAVLVRYGDTVVLVNATMSQQVREGIDFFPLTCDYEERLYAVGKIPGGFIKREGRPSEKATLTARLIDRPIRPLFPKGLRNEVQVIALVLSVDKDNPPEMAAMVGASAALHISNIPFNGPIGAVTVGRVDNKLIINPNIVDAEKSDMHLVVAGTSDAIMMVEAGAKEVPENEMLEAIIFGHEKIKEIVKFIEDFRAEALAMGLAKEKYNPELTVIDEELESVITARVTEEIKSAVQEGIVKQLSKKEREDLIDGVKDKLTLELLEEYPEQSKAIVNVIESVEKKVVRRFILVDRVRVDGRALNEVRPISVEVGILPRTHGSGLFTRGQTQVLSIVTLGAISEEQRLDGLGIEESKRYMHHYNFPPFSTGETKPMRSPGRREIGHGALAERALEPVIPAEDKFPYTIRVVSEVLESNGSTSMGSVCGSCLSLMDAGVPIKAPVAGVAMGLIKEGDEFAVLTDIQGLEDHLGDMDFKVAGTAKGVTALQMDIKIAGIDREILQIALSQANEGRMHILGKMLEVIDKPRTDLSLYAPRIIQTIIDPDKIRDVIGPGGKIIKKIIEETGVDIDIEDDGRVFIAAVNPEAGHQALSMVEKLTKDVESGQIYNGKVVKITDFGCFVEIIPGVLGLPGKDGLVHISQLAHERVNKVEDVVNEGDMLEVKVIGYDNQGRLKLSHKDLLPVPEGIEYKERVRENRDNRRPQRNQRRTPSNRTTS